MTMLKRHFILLGLVVLLLDLADCTLLGKATFSGPPSLCQSGSIFSQPFYQHTKVFSRDCDFQAVQLPILTHLPDIPFSTFQTQPAADEVPHPLKIIHSCYFCGSGGIPL
ncbi:MAG: hypothetical protein A2Y80_03075 [Deltaproteobacteria bacterium RBG_13_58_19]|nr:MAG: hypothetical protein A2Y80_03075 [Deltaproteobacteria bacterium RBG_13_58_19]